MDPVGLGRILLIEDDSVIAEMYRLKLESQGWELEVAWDGESGLRSALKSRPALVLLDIMLPGLNGIEVLRGLRAAGSTRDVPVLIVSNSAGGGRGVREARALGIAGWLIKARITPAGLAARVARILPPSNS
jgi:DNA-binding response OmpR family regulator